MASISRHVLQYKENMEMRMKHADAPERFMESEVDLDEAVKRLLSVSGCGMQDTSPCPVMDSGDAVP